MTNITDEYGIDKVLEERFKHFIRRFKINRILRKIGANKVKGVLASVLFPFLMGLVFTRKNFFETINSERSNLSYGKDTVYRFLDRPQVRWEELIPELASAVIPEIDRLTSEKRISAWMFDDSPYYRNRSKKVELLSRCKDHSEGKYYNGFTFLSMGWSDGVSFVPADFRVVASGNDKNLLEGSHVKEDNRTRATKRRTDARTDKPALVLKMLKRAKRTHAETKHVLFDSWFSSPKAILDIKEMGFDVVARLKNHKNFRYLYNGELLSLKQIYEKSKKRRGKARFLLSVSVYVRHIDYEDSVPATIVFVRNKNNRKEWIALISTDTTLTEDEIIALYGKRWDIEPYHKVIKSGLRLTKEFQFRSFDAICAHAAIVLARYIFIALESRENKDGLSFGEIGLLFYEELEDISFQHALTLLLSAMEHCLAEYLLLSNDIIKGIVLFFMDSLPSFIKGRLRFDMCES
jgi:hypothetical protein